MNKTQARTSGITALGATVQSSMLWLSAGFALAMMAAACFKVWLPFSPVPVTLQTFVVLLAGLSLGATWGGLSQVQYVILGMLGLPAFVGGMAALFGPTGGYIVGFVVAAVIVGAIYSAWRTTPGAIVACLAGTAAIYVFGCIWLLALRIGSVAEVAAIGVLPFLPGDALKLAAAVALVRAPLTGPAIRRLCGHH
jgi:biotin transport system substrate-specific component